MSYRKCAFVLYIPSRFQSKNDSGVSKLISKFNSSLENLLQNESARVTLFEPGWMMQISSDFSSKEIISMKQRIRERRLEVLGGGFHDPMLPLFPKNLQKLQLKKHRHWVEKIFSTEPVGYFNSSMAWELGEVDLLAQEMFEYTLVPGTALQSALGKTTRVNGWFTTEYRGSILHLLTITNDLISAFMKGVDSFYEKLNELPETDKCWVVALPVPWWDAKAMAKFFKDLNKIYSDEKIQTWTCSHIFEQQYSEGKVNLMTALAFGLGLPPGSDSCRELLIRRPEIDFLHKSLLSVYRKSTEILNHEDLKAVEEQLLPAMAPYYYSDLYGIEGMRSFEVRRDAFRKIIEAENKAFQLTDFQSQSIDISDYLMDGKRQIWMNNRDISLLLSYHHGGALRSLNHRRSGINWVNALDDAGEVPFAFYDFILPNLSGNAEVFEAFLQDRKGELTAPYDYQILRTESSMDILLSAEQVVTVAEKNQGFRIEKKYSLLSHKAQLSVSYRLTHITFIDFCGYFGTAVDFGILDNEAFQKIKIDGHEISLKKLPLLYSEASEFEISDKHFSGVISFHFKQPVRILLSAILGANNSAEPNLIQGLRAFFFRDMSLTSQNEELFEISCKLSGKRWLS